MIPAQAIKASCNECCISATNQPLVADTWQSLRRFTAARIALDAPRTWQVGNASINRLLHGDHGFTLVGWADSFHLEDPALDEGTA